MRRQRRQPTSSTTHPRAPWPEGRRRAGVKTPVAASGTGAPGGRFAGSGSQAEATAMPEAERLATRKKRMAEVRELRAKHREACACLWPGMLLRPLMLADLINHKVAADVTGLQTRWARRASLL